MLLVLLRSPHSQVTSPEMEVRWCDLVVKCLIKLTKALPNTIEVGHWHFCTN